LVGLDRDLPGTQRAGHARSGSPSGEADTTTGHGLLGTGFSRPVRCGEARTPPPIRGWGHNPPPTPRA